MRKGRRREEEGVEGEEEGKRREWRERRGREEEGVEGEKRKGTGGRGRDGRRGY